MIRLRLSAPAPNPEQPELARSTLELNLLPLRVVVGSPLLPPLLLFLLSSSPPPLY